MMRAALVVGLCALGLAAARAPRSPDAVTVADSVAPGGGPLGGGAGGAGGFGGGSMGPKPQK